MEKIKLTNRPFKHTTTYYRKVKFYTRQNKNKVVSYGESEQNNIKWKEEFEPPSISTVDKTEKVLPGNSNHNSLENIYLENNSNENQVFEDTFDDNYQDDNYQDIFEKSLPLVDEIKNWALRNHIKHSALDELLKLLISFDIKHLPKDSRTLLKTPKMVDIQKMGTGEFWYNGLEENLLNNLSDLQGPTNLLLNFHVDGLPIYGSSKNQFWPILVNIANMTHISPMVIAIYSGVSKPPSAEIFLKQFVDELNKILVGGIIINKHQVNVKVNSIICDTPARCFVKCIVNFNAYNSCNKCVVIGEYHKNGRHMSFPQVDLPLRTNEDFRNKKDADHHLTDCSAENFIKSPLENLPIDMIKDIPVADSLHLIDLGIMKRCLIGWTRGSHNFRTKFFIPY